MSKVLKLGNGEVDLNRPKRRHFSAGFKLRILGEVDACSVPGQIAALLRREVCHSERFVDRAPAEIQATLMDESV